MLPIGNTTATPIPFGFSPPLEGAGEAFCFRPPLRMMARSFVCNESRSAKLSCLNTFPAIRGWRQKSLMRCQSVVSMPACCMSFKHRLRFFFSCTLQPVCSSSDAHMAAYSFTLISCRWTVLPFVKLDTNVSLSAPGSFFNRQ